MVTNCVESKDNDIMRRKSWAALDDLTKYSLQIIKQQKRYLHKIINMLFNVKKYI